MSFNFCFKLSDDKIVHQCASYITCKKLKVDVKRTSFKINSNAWVQTSRKTKNKKSLKLMLMYLKNNNNIKKCLRSNQH